MVGIAAGVLIAWGWGWLAVRFGPRLGWVDRPDDPSLKVHRRPAVPLGGVGLYLAVQVGMLAAGIFSGPLALASGLLLALGLIDDRVGVSPVLRLGFEGAAGLVLGLAVGNREPLRVAMIAVLVLVAVNAVNLLDGLDGLAPTTGAVTAFGLSWLAYARGFDHRFGLILAAALVGFLVWNWHPARLFLGDNGAYVLGVLMVYAMVTASPGAYDLALAAAVFGVFLVDLAATLLRRLLLRRPLFTGDRSHLYDRLSDRGVGVRRIATLAGGLQALWVGLVLLVAWNLGRPTSLLALGILAVALTAGLVKLLGVVVPSAGSDPLQQL